MIWTAHLCHQSRAPKALIYSPVEIVHYLFPWPTHPESNSVSPVLSLHADLWLSSKAPNTVANPTMTSPSVKQLWSSTFPQCTPMSWPSFSTPTTTASLSESARKARPTRHPRQQYRQLHRQLHNFPQSSPTSLHNFFCGAFHNVIENALLKFMRSLSNSHNIKKLITKQTLFVLFLVFPLFHSLLGWFLGAANQILNFEGYFVFCCLWSATTRYISEGFGREMWFS